MNLRDVADVILTTAVARGLTAHFDTGWSVDVSDTITFYIDGRKAFTVTRVEAVEVGTDKDALAALVNKKLGDPNG